MAGKGWDLTSTSALEAAVRWLMTKGNAQVVLVVRAEDMAFDCAKTMRPRDAVALVERVMPTAMARVNELRVEARRKAQAKGLGEAQ